MSRNFFEQLLRGLLVLGMTLLLFRFINGAWDFDILIIFISWLAADKLVPQIEDIKK